MKKVWDFMVKYDEVVGSFAFVFTILLFFWLALMRI